MRSLIFIFMMNLLISGFTPIANAQQAPGDPCVAGENGHYKLSGGADLGGDTYFLVCNGSEWLRVFSVEGARVLRPQFTNGDSCRTGDVISYDAATGGMKCNPCPDVTTPGGTCPDGSVYVGLSPDGNVPMYMTSIAYEGVSTYAADNGRPAGSYPICPASGPATPACWTGVQNTLELAALPHPQVQDIPRYCHNLVAHGRDDWYLPSRDEFILAGQMHATYGSDLGESSADYFEWYPTSSTIDADHFWVINFNGGGTFNQGWNGNQFPIRCVRK